MKDLSIDHVLHILEACSIPHALLDLAGEYRLVIVERGGHALGPFDSDGRGVLWLNPTAWEFAHSMSRFVADGQWNIGGERLWLAPEIRFTIRDRADIWGSYFLPSDMDPGRYQLEAAGNMASLNAEAALSYYNPADGTFAFASNGAIARCQIPCAICNSLLN